LVEKFNKRQAREQQKIILSWVDLDA